MAVSVKITKVVDPKTFLAYETDSGYRQIKLNMIQKELEEQWRDAEEIVMVSPSEPVSVLVEGKFCRGEIKTVWRENLRLKANVFLMDFGSTIEIDVKKYARKVEVKDQALEPPLAFEIVLKGLYPVSMDIDWKSESKNLQKLRRRAWDESATKLVKQVVKICQGNAKLLDASTFPTRRIGSLVLLKPSPSSASKPEEINLINILLENNFAGQDRLEVERDLMEAESDLGLGSESDSLSSDEEETAECEYNPQPLLTTQQKMRNLQLYVSEEAEAAPANNNIRSFDTNSVSSRGVGRGLGRRVGVEVAGNYSSQVDQALKLQESLIKGREVKREEPQEQEESDSEDIWSQFRKDLKKGEGEPRDHVVPGGILLGKHHENIVANIKSRSGVDLKKKFTKLVCK